MAERRFQTRQSLDYEVKELFAKGTISPVGGAYPSGATTALTADITYTSATAGTARNADTITIQVLAAAANPTDTVLADITGTIDAVIITITPNDGTNNAATAVDLTTAELAELVSSGVVVGKTVTLVDSGSLLDDLSATGGDATDLADSGEGDGAAATLSGGTVGSVVLDSSVVGIESISRVSAGRWLITLEDAYTAFRSFNGILQSSTAQNIKVQLKAESVSSKTVEFYTVTTATATDPAESSIMIIKLELKNSSTGE